MLFNMVDRRYSKDGPNSMVFTSNLTANKWCDFFNEDDSLLCALNRIFDDAIVWSHIPRKEAGNALYRDVEGKQQINQGMCWCVGDFA